MPKIIMNLENRLMEEANRQVRENGYCNTTIRSVATACGVGVGTVYNYFPSKEALLSRYLLADWNERITAINAVSTYSDSPMPVLRCIYDQLQVYTSRHHVLFQDPDAAASFATSSCFSPPSGAATATEIPSSLIYATQSVYPFAMIRLSIWASDSAVWMISSSSALDSAAFVLSL